MKIIWLTGDRKSTTRWRSTNWGKTTTICYLHGAVLTDIAVIVGNEEFVEAVQRRNRKTSTGALLFLVRCQPLFHISDRTHRTLQKRQQPNRREKNGVGQTNRPFGRTKQSRPWSENSVRTSAAYGEWVIGRRKHDKYSWKETKKSEKEEKERPDALWSWKDAYKSCRWRSGEEGQFWDDPGDLENVLSLVETSNNTRKTTFPTKLQ